MARVCEIIAVGTELLLGSVTNTDAQMIAQGLCEVGIHCYYHTTVGDNPERLRAALRIARERADIIITTGGLGPTCDDLTKQTVCGEFQVPLQRHEPTWERILCYFEKLGRPVTANNEQQAMLPEGGVLLENDWGTAPGCGFTAQDGTQVYLLPGPPSECSPMFKKCLLPILREQSGLSFVSRNVRIFGMGESAVESRLRPLMETAQNPTLAPYAAEGEVLLRVTASAPTQEEAFALTNPMVGQVCEQLGDLVYGVDVEHLEGVVLGLLERHRVRLAVAESCTGGMVASRLTSVPGASAWFSGGVTAYQTSLKTGILGIPGKTIEQFGVVSGEVALEMAKGVCRCTGAELGLGVTGLAGPDGDGSDTPVGTVCLSLYDSRSGYEKTVSDYFGDERHRVRVMAAGTALNLIRLYLGGKEQSL